MPDWESRRAILQEVTRWEFQGRIGASAGDEGFNGKLWWWQRDDDFRATISGPLGFGKVKIAGFGSRFTITDKDGAVTEIADAEEDLRARFGWTIPVDSLRFWALGIPDPGFPAVSEFNDDGLLASLEQQGWRVTINQYRAAGNQPMPRRLVAVSDGARVVLVIDDWAFF